MNIITFTTILGFSTLGLCIVCVMIHKNNANLKKQVDKHHDFLLKVKHDIPILSQTIADLQSQILPPEEHELH